MSKFCVTGIIERETIISVEKIPIEYRPVTTALRSINTCLGGDSYDEAIALKWLKDAVNLFSVIGKDDDPDMINRNSNDVTLNTEYILPVLEGTPATVIFYDSERNQQSFEDIKDTRDVAYDLCYFEQEMKVSDLLLTANANFCRPFVSKAREYGKKVAVNIRKFDREKEQYNEFFLKNADILYLSDDGLEEDPYDFVKYIVSKYKPEIVILGQGAKGVLVYTAGENTYVTYKSVKTLDIVNTVGAGNALFSCFLHYYLETGDSVSAIKNALLFASYKIGFAGSSNGFMTPEQIDYWHGLIWK